MWLLYQNLQFCIDGYNFTLNEMYGRSALSFQALRHGEEPTVDWNGNPIPGAAPGVKLMKGLYMCVWALICDLDHVFKYYGVPNCNSNHPCGICPVDSKDMPVQAQCFLDCQGLHQDGVVECWIEEEPNFWHHWRVLFVVLSWLDALQISRHWQVTSWFQGEL